MFDRVLNNTLSKNPGEMASGFPGRQFAEITSPANTWKNRLPVI